MSYRLLHLADLHLDRAFGGMGCHGELARRRRQGLRDALRTAGKAAIDHGCQTITIGGDLYEDERADADTGRFLSTLFESWQPLTVLITPGNHDALQPGSIYRRTQWPDNVHIFKETTLAAHPLADGLTIWGLAHREKSWTGDPLSSVPAHTDGGVHIALFHGAELGSRPEGKSIHGPFRAEHIRQRGFDAALCGHYHGRRIDKERGLVYPGTPEPLTFDETGARGPVVVTIEGNGSVSFEGLALNAWTALATTVDVTAATSPDDVGALVTSVVRAAARDISPHRALIRVDVTGDRSAANAIDVADLERQVRESTDLTVVKIRDLTTTALDVATIQSERTSRGAFARDAQAALAGAADDAERKVIADALRYGLQALSGAEVALR